MTAECAGFGDQEIARLPDCTLAEILPEIAGRAPADEIIVRQQKIQTVANWACLNSVLFDVQDSPRKKRSGDADPLTSRFDYDCVPSFGKRAETWPPVLAGFTTHWRPDLRVGINPHIMRLRLGNQANDPQVWSALLNKRLGWHMRNAASRHLLGSLHSMLEGGIYTVAAMGFEMLFASEVDNIFDAGTSLPLALGATSLFSLVAKLKLQRAQHKPLARSCYSLFPGSHYDRLAMASLRTCGKLVRARKACE